MENLRTPAVLRAKTAGEAWVIYNDYVLKYGLKIIDDKEDIFESGPVSLFIEETSRSDEIINQYGDPHIIDIYSKKMFSKELIKELNSTYGDRLFDNNGVDQVSWITERLSRKWWTKAAAISLLKPNDPGPRIPCLTQIQFLVRNHLLELHAIFRSQNVFRSYGNFIGLKDLQDLVGKALSISPGPMSLYIVSPHIYSSDKKSAEDIKLPATSQR